MGIASEPQGRTKVFLSTVGRAVDPADATISVFDRGFLFGDSVYETTRTTGGVMLEWNAHLDRLRRSGDGIGLEIPFGDEQLLRACQLTHSETGNPESYVRVIVTRGESPLGLDPRLARDPVLVVLVQPLRLPAAEVYRRGVRAVVVDTQRMGRRQVDPGFKTGNYLNNILALREALAAGADEPIMCNAEGGITEGATANVFAVLGGRLVTPSIGSGLLPGITRTRIVALARDLGHEVEERVVDPRELREAEEMFFTSSVRGVMPITTVDHAPVGDGTVGPVTQALSGAYEAFVEAAAAGAQT